MAEKMINLGHRSESIGMAVEPEKKNEIYYPSLYLNGVNDLGLSDDDLNKEIEVKATVKVTRIRKTVQNGKTDYSYDLEVQEICFYD